MCVVWDSVGRGVGEGKGRGQERGERGVVDECERPQWTFTGKQSALYGGKVEKRAGKKVEKRGRMVGQERRCREQKGK